MGVMKYVLVAASLIATDVAFAETTTLAFNSSPLMPGSRVVAGDLNKNEFFITGKDEPPAIRMAQENHNQQPAELVPTLAPTPKIKMAANQPVVAEKKPLAPEVKVALNKTLKSNVADKPMTLEKTMSQPVVYQPAQTMTALNHEPRLNTHSEKLHLVNKANDVVKDSQHKTAMHKTNFYSFKQPTVKQPPVKQHTPIISAPTHVASTHATSTRLAGARVVNKHVTSAHVASKHSADKHIASTHTLSKLVANKSVVSKHIASKRIVSKHVASSVRVTIQKPITHHLAHKNYAQMQIKKPQYKFVSLTKQRHTVQIKTAFHGKNHHPKKTVITKI